MKKGIIYSLIIIIALTLSNVLACSESKSNLRIGFPEKMGPEYNDYEIDVQCELPTINSLMVYKVIKPDITLDYVKSIGIKLGYSGDGTVGQDDICMAGKDGEYSSSLRVGIKTGNIIYYVPDRKRVDSKNMPIMPTYEEARTIADRFLKDLGLLPPDASFDRVAEGGKLSRFNGETGESQDLGVLSLDVVYGRTINGIKIIGMCQKLVVEIAEDGVASCFKFWRDLESYRTMPIKNIDKALAQVTESKYGFHNAVEGTTRVIINSASICYWVGYDNTGVELEYAVPVYEFISKCLDVNNEEIGDYTACVEALDI